MRAIDGDALQEKLTKKRPGPANARYTEGFNDALLRFKSMIHAAPTIEPERKRAYLINPNPYGECSNCGYLIDIRDKYHFCPNCGEQI